MWSERLEQKSLCWHFWSVPARNGVGGIFTCLRDSLVDTGKHPRVNSSTARFVKTLRRIKVRVGPEGFEPPID